MAGKILSQLSRDHQYKILRTEPSHDASMYPRTRTCETGSYRQFQPSWLKQYPWLHYSCFSDGAFCRACALFAPDQVGGHDIGNFVTKPFRAWIKMSEKVGIHAKKDYHLAALSKMDEFIGRYENQSKAIDVMLHTKLMERLEHNQHVIESLLKVVILCGKQGLALRGHRDDLVDWKDEASSNEGNFIQLVRFRAETDPILAKHLAESPKNARYTSKGIQNELIDVVANRIRSDIIAEVQQAKFYSIIADEVTDAGNREELSLVLRYVFNDEVKEVFVDFIEVERITGEVLAKSILAWVEKNDLCLLDMRGQCYDGASNMSGARSGCKAIIQQSAPLAMYYHCASHRLNLAVVSACKIQCFKNAESNIGEIARFFNFSAKRQRLLDKCIDKLDSTRAKKLKDACRTRWVERIESYATFLQLLPAVNTSLEAMAHPTLHADLGTDWSWDGETVTKANGFLYQLQSSPFLVAFYILLQVLQVLKELTVKLQRLAMDVVKAYKMVSSVTSTLRKMRTESETEFHKVFVEARSLGKKLHGDEFELEKPRITSRMANRDNPSTSSAEDYYRIVMYDEFLSHVVSELDERFANNPAHSTAKGLLYLLPSECAKLEDDVTLPSELAEAVSTYDMDMPNPSMISIEYSDWVRKWKGVPSSTNTSSDLPDRLIDSFKQCNRICYPNLHTLFRIALTLPITSCQSERSFSQLKLIKTACRSTMVESRLSSLSLMKMNRDRCNKLMNPCNIKKLVEKFAMRNPKRIRLPFMLSDSETNSELQE